MIQPTVVNTPVTAPTPLVVPPRPTTQQRVPDQERGMLETSITATADGDDAAAYDREGSYLQAAADRAMTRGNPKRGDTIDIHV